MSAIIDALGALLAGDPVEHGRLLPSCTAEAFAAEAFGEAAIRELFARNPNPLSAVPHVILTDRYAAVFDADAGGREQALLVEIHDQRIARVWRLGEGAADRAVEPTLCVGADPFLGQEREAVAFDARDFPSLDPTAGPAVAAALAESLAHRLEAADTADRRVIALRAFSAGPLTAVLAQVLGPRTPPTLIAIALRLAGGACVRAWRVTDGRRTQRIFDDLTTLRDSRASQRDSS
jgi:hypothetical protein